MAETPVPRLEMMHSRLQAAVSQLEEKHKDDAWMLDYVAGYEDLVYEYIAVYEEGRPVFARDMVASLDRQIDALQQPGAVEREDGGIVTLVDFIGRQESWPLRHSKISDEEFDTFSIHWCAHQHMTHMSPHRPDLMLQIECPVSILYSVSVKPSGWPLSELEAAFRAHQATWGQSAECQALVAIIEASAVGLRSPIRKIVCFGLGRLDEWAGRTTSDELAKSTRRAAMQHAAALTMAGALTRVQGAGDDVRCYAQDPSYSNVEKELLAGLGFTVLEDPKGFLEVDDRTLVFSVMPNVPVRQIVADMGWPAAMVWNTIEPNRNEENVKDYQTEHRDGLEVLISPWSTDEGSIRVTEMGRHYSYAPFPGDPDVNDFGSLGIYFRE